MTTSSPLLRVRRSGVARPLAFLALAAALAFGAFRAAADEPGHGAPAADATHHAAAPAEAHHAADDHASPAAHATAHDGAAADGHGDGHGGGHGAKKAEEKPRIHIASLFDVIKAWNKDTYDIKHHLTDAKAEVKALEQKIVAAEEAGDAAALARLEAQLASAEEHLHEYKTQYAATTGLSRALIWIYKHSYGFIAVLIIVLWVMLARRMSAAAALKPQGWGTVGELFVRGLYGLYEPVLGKDEIRRYFPFLASLFCFILFNNLMSVVPLSKSPSAVFFNNLGLGLAVFFYVQYIGITRCGPKDYVLHFMGNPQGFIGWFLGVFLLLPLEILAELVRPISLSLRLFGNIMGEDILLLVFCTIGLQVTAGMLGPVGEYAPLGIPMHFALYPIILMGSTLQALVFTILTAVYISLKLPHGHHDEEHGHDHGGGHAHAH